MEVSIVEHKSNTDEVQILSSISRSGSPHERLLCCDHLFAFCSRCSISLSIVRDFMYHAVVYSQSESGAFNAGYRIINVGLP